MQRVFDRPEKLELFMDCEDSYQKLMHASFPIARYVKTRMLIREISDEKEQRIKIPPIDAARKLDATDTHLPMPDDIFCFIEKAYQDGYYQINDFRCAYDLGRSYSEERYGHIDYGKAAVWYARGAKALDGEAEAKLGKCYYLGLGVPVDYRKAFHYMVKWALTEGRGSAEAMYLLGDMYLYGYYVDRDEVQSYELYQRAEDLLYGESIRYGAEVYLRLANYNLEQIRTEESCQVALEYYQKAESAGYEQRRVRYQNVDKLLEEAVAGQERARKVIAELRKASQDDNDRYLHDAVADEEEQM